MNGYTGKEVTCYFVQTIDETVKVAENLLAEMMSQPLFEKKDTAEFSSSVIAEEAKRIKNILERRKTDSIYQPSFFGALANVMIKRISFFLLDTFQYHLLPVSFSLLCHFMNLF